MSNNTIVLSQLFEKNNISSELKLDNIRVKNVKIDSYNKRAKVILSSKDLIDIKLLGKIEEIFKSVFKNIDISVKIQYKLSGQKKDIIGRYWNSILDYIDNELPSSSSWSKDLSWDMDKNCITIYPTNDITNYSLKNNKIDSKIKAMILEELNIDVDVELDDSKIKNNEESFMEKTFIEEKKIAVEILNSSNNNIATKKKTMPNRNYTFGKKTSGKSMDIKDINLNTGSAIISGEVFQMENIDIRGNKKLVIFNMSDLVDSITVKVFLSKKQFDEFNASVINGLSVKVEGNIVYDNYSKNLVLMLKSLMMLEKKKRVDSSKEKRVELHLHSNMSSMDGTTNFKDFAEQAKEWGHKSIAITDHGIVQAFPEAMEAGKELDLKIIYGVEGYLVKDDKPIVDNYEKNCDYPNYVVFDLETTGLSPKNDMITEIGGIKIENGVVVDEFSQLINPQRPIPQKIVKLTGISDDMVRDKPTIAEVLPEFSNFIDDSVLVAHNASFDMGFLRKQFSKFDETVNNPVLDTLELSRTLFPQLKSHRLNLVAKHLDISLINHHRAVDDAKATAEIFLKSVDMLEDNKINDFCQMNKLTSQTDSIKDEFFHIIILAKNKVGLKNLYKIISKSHMDYFYRQPRIPKSLLDEHKEGLILGTACEAGELYKAFLRNKDDDVIKNIVSYYDYLEIQPIENNMYQVRNNLVKNVEEIKTINKSIVELGEKFNKPVVATGDVHFLNPEDEVYRRILMSGQGFSDADLQPPLYFKTTDEMLKEFQYLGESKAREVVVENTNLIDSMIDDMVPIPEGTYPPVLEGSEEELKEISYNNAFEIYGDPLPKIVKERLDRELNAIIENGYAVMYIISQKLVAKSMEEGYLVGSRGSVGSSFLATMSDITEVNPLVPHYICPNCKYSEFIEDGSIGSGFDLPEKNCPDCNTELIRDGHDIPFEIFLGFKGDKEPDIDLNFAGEYQSKAQEHTEELFGKEYVYRAGTIGTIADKTAYGFVKKYHEKNELSVHPAEINRLVEGCTGVKRTSGQHPGGVMIVPKYKDIYDFTPIQYPANDKESGRITTHFDYHSISSSILKLDILGHDVPTIIKMLEDITGVDPRAIPLNDPKTMKIFTSIETLNIKDEDIDLDVGTLGIPEFGTRFVRQMLLDTKPTTFAELVRISGLSHGTDVWINNAQNLVRSKTANLNQVISTRDDIMLYLIHSGLDKELSFKIMENVRKGRGLSEEDERQMRELNIPKWYIDSCKKIKYMFPKAHAAAYVTMSFRIAYFKVHYPEAFYATYFTTKAHDFDAQLVLKGREAVSNKMKEIENLNNDATAKEKNVLTVLEVVEEMYARGFGFRRVDLYRSHSDNFLNGDNGILPPLKSLDGVGEKAAKRIVEGRKEGEFMSIEDLGQRTKVTKTVLAALKEHKCLTGLPESNQISLFNI